MNSEIEMVNTLLEAVYKFYPIGAPELGVRYQGFSNYNAILTKKINAEIENKKTAWSRLVEVIEKDFSLNLLNMNYLQFPCHLAKCEIKNESDQRYDFKRTLVINLSLLCNFFTVYFEDSYIYKNYTQNLMKPKTVILFSQQQEMNNASNDLITGLKNIIRIYFPAYDYVSHMVLFQHKIRGGHPYTESEIKDEGSYSIYQFLFDAFYKEDCIYLVD